jgi:aminoglycoside phosphotransferase (APT) family kinase protein
MAGDTRSDARGDVGPRLLRYLRAELRRPDLDLAEPVTPLSGGFDTSIFAFRLSGAVPALAGPLILRVLASHHDPRRALRERATQNAVASMGFPAPRVPLASADATILGGAFLVMERRPGQPLLAARPLDIARLLVETQLQLHALDPDVLLGALEREGPGTGALVTLDGHLGQIEKRIHRRTLDGLRSAMRWLQDNRPAGGETCAICHGDFHPQNLLVEGGTVTAVLDWPNVLVADPAYDVATTRVILGCAPLELLPIRPLRRWLMRAGLRLLLARYLGGYRRQRPLDPAGLAYYEALACMRGLVRTAESRTAAAGEGGPPTPVNPLDASSFGDRLAARFAGLTGIAPALPAVGGRP